MCLRETAPVPRSSSDSPFYQLIIHRYIHNCDKRYEKNKKEYIWLRKFAEEGPGALLTELFIVLCGKAQFWVILVYLLLFFMEKRSFEAYIYRNFIVFFLKLIQISLNSDLPPLDGSKCRRARSLL